MPEHRIYPHGPLQELAPGLWIVRGTMGRNPLPRNMVVYRLAGGGLLIHSAVAMNAQGMAALEALGKPRLMIVPNRFHRLDAPFYAARYPDMQVLVPARVRKWVEQKTRVDGHAEEVLPPLGIACHRPDGVAPFELVFELPLATGRALVCTDILFNLPRLPGLRGLMVWLMGSSGFFGMSRIGRWFALRDAQAHAGWLRRMAELPGLTWVVMAHGEPVGASCAERLREAAARLEP